MDTHSYGIETDLAHLNLMFEIPTAQIALLIINTNIYLQKNM